MITINGFSTEKPEEMIQKMAQAGATITLPFKGEAKTEDSTVASIPFVDPDGEQVVVTLI